eukprot:3182354-Amphidinium_carterae.1
MHALLAVHCNLPWAAAHSFDLDLADAYLSVPIAAEERRFSCAKVAEGVIVWRCLGFGGREYPL